MIALAASPFEFAFCRLLQLVTQRILPQIVMITLAQIAPLRPKKIVAEDVSSWLAQGNAFIRQMRDLIMRELTPTESEIAVILATAKATKYEGIGLMSIERVYLTTQHIDRILEDLTTAIYATEESFAHAEACVDGFNRSIEMIIDDAYRNIHPELEARDGFLYLK